MTTEMQVNSKIQSALKKLIADEYLAGQLYMLWVMSAPADQKLFISDVFSEISRKKIEGMQDMVKWCAANGYDIPCTNSEMHRIATEAIRKLSQNTRRCKTADECIKLAVKLETNAMDSVKKFLETDGVVEYPDVQAALWNIYYDCESYLGRFETMLTVWQSGADTLQFGF